MKSKIFTGFLAAVLCWSVAYAENFSDTIPEPEFTNQPYFFDKPNNKLIQLEAVSAKMKSKVKAMGYGGVSNGYEINGANSSAIITTEDNIEFVMTGSSMLDATQFISLYKLKSSKNAREAITMQHKGMFGKPKDDDNKINFNVKKDSGKYVLVIAKKLEPGEYAFINMMSMDASQTIKAYCFKIE